eukprot:CAMPEP_0203748582 /NCGR_PEP_ID=MMETSP0098-20131031/3428_1 /ASSEMBLY_ACC=CAM_ASM_000208 /TAXON_ID=96639 /ORGANISM=" , Strain NY0313808BC1" /LENGTH=340 /DNA_ID=CAMNT_0050637369 /DNA_START=289 /DNA_END=1309 /DNA_ORIENTATION=+
MAAAPHGVQKKRVESMRFYAAGSKIPHPGKSGEGEDSHYITECGMSLGVSDGVGGWAEIGVDAGEYARELTESAVQYVADTGDTNPLEIMQVAYENSKSVGSATLCCATLSRNRLKVANLGDSTIVVIRDTPEGWEVIMHTESQQHYFNCPRQLGSNSVDTPQDAELYECKVKDGDIVIAGTDGLFDNLSIEDIVAAIETSEIEVTKDETTLSKIAHHVATTAFRASRDSTLLTPFAQEAQLHGFPFNGGKLDDITVVVGVVATHTKRCSLEPTSPNPAASPSGGVYFPPSVFSMDSLADTMTKPASPRSPDTHYSSCHSSTNEETDDSGTERMEDDPVR